MQQDEDHLRLLSIFHYVVGGLAALFACFPVFHLVMGIVFIILSGRPADGEPVPALFGWLFVFIAGSIMLAGWALAACIITAGRFLAARRHYLFCLVMAGVECLFMPFGTVLGAFTIVVLSRPGVKKMFPTGRTAPSA